MLNGTTWVKSALFCHVGSVSFFGSCVATDVAIHPVEFYGRLKPVSVTSNAKVATRVSRLRAALVLHIHGCRNIAQVVKSVVRLITVNVVNVSGRPSPSHEKPRETMRAEKTVIEADSNIPMHAFGPSNIAGTRPEALPRYQARENTCLRVVMQKFAQTLRSKIGLSHDAVLSRSGQRPACVSSTCGLRYFSGNHATPHHQNCR